MAVFRRKFSALPCRVFICIAWSARQGGLFGWQRVVIRGREVYIMSGRGVWEWEDKVGW